MPRHLQSIHGSKTGGTGGVAPPQPQRDSAGAQRALTRSSKPSLPKLRDKGQREPLSSPGGGSSMCGQVPTRSGPRAAGEGSAGHFPAPPAAASCRNTVCSVVLESHFSRPGESQGISSQNPHDEVCWLVLPAHAARGCPGPPPPQSCQAASGAKPAGFSGLAEIFYRHLVQGEEPS